MDCSLPGSSVHGDSAGKNVGVACQALLQGSSCPEDQIHISFVSCIGRWVSSLLLAPPGKLLCYAVDPYELPLLYNSMSIPVFQFIPPLLTLWLSGKESAVQETLEMWVWSLGREDPLEEETATHSSTLA